MANPEKALAFMNSHFAIATVGQEPRVVVLKDPLVQWDEDDYDNKPNLEKPIYWKIYALEVMFRSDFVDIETLTNKGKLKIDRIQMADWWLGHGSCRRYLKTEFDPENMETGTILNLWRGFAKEAREGDWTLFHNHVRDIICGGNTELFDYVYKWMAFAIQRPGTPPEVALVLRGAKGSGKSSFANIFGKLFGEHFMALSNRIHLTGQFLSHLRDKVVLLVDEGYWAGDKEGEGVLKQLISEPKLGTEAKHVDMDTTRNCLHVIMASNESWVVPARGAERRYCVLDVKDIYAQDTSYFGSIYRQMEKEGGLEAMLYDLKRVDLSDFEVRLAPKTSGLAEQLLHSLNPLESWWYGRLCDGQLLKDQPGWSKVQINKLHLSYTLEAKQGQHAYNKQQFGGELRKFIPSPGLVTKQHRDARDIPRRFYEMPPLEDCRTEWERIHRVKVDWETEEVKDDE